MRSQTLTLYDTVEFVTEECYSCGVLFAMTAHFKKSCLDKRGPSGKQFYCPNGHAQHYTGKTDAERAKERAAELERQLASRNEDVRAAYMRLEAEQRSHSATKGQLTKAKKRAVNGVCPCCHRTFANVARHVATKHPEAVSDAQSPPPAGFLA